MATLAKLAKVPVERVSGMAGKRGSALRRNGIVSVADLLMHVPRRYLDRSRIEPVANLPVGEEVTLIAEVVSVSIRRPRRGLTIVEARLSDGTGRIKAVWFNQPFRERQLRPGTEVALSGKVERFRGSVQMKTPVVDVLSGDEETIHTGRVVPIHTAPKEVGPGWMRRGIHNALSRSRPIPDPLPAALIDDHRLVGRDAAYAAIHFPDSVEEIAPARRRLVFDELFRLELALALNKRRQIRESRGVAHRVDGPLVLRFSDGLPYDLTGAQRRVMGEIAGDLEAGHAMHRLLQGEVGSGKTVVAVMTLLAGIQGGWQGAVMAPTEVLAGQHFLAITALLEEAGLAPPPARADELGMESLFGSGGPTVAVALVTSSQVSTNFSSEGRAAVLTAIAAGKVDLVIGTHALIQEGVHFERLGVAVVDEQHRFGVAQRVLLKEKGGDVDPDLLIMTATPIPRTLSMTLYGDLDVSVLDELPPGRVPVATSAWSRSDEGRAWEVVRAEVAAGHQAYVICPLVDESEKVEAASATAEYERLRGVFAGLRLGLLHGQLPSRDKADVMARFREGEIDVLVATTVIEVGIDVANATAIVIEDADRFGLSQLHQLRGRVGRGADRGICVLLSDPTTDEGISRVEAMVTTSDGFLLAEEDLRIRGQGTVFGTRQSGVADLKLADVLADFDTLMATRREAFALVERDPELRSHPELREEIGALLGDAVGWLFVS